MEHKKVKLSQCELHYVESLPTKKMQSKTLIFLHGFPEAWFAWRNQLNALSRDYRVIAPDLPGYNLSEKISDNAFYQVPNLISVMKEFVEAVSHQQKVVLVAHDWGGAIAWPLVAFHPQLFDKFVVLNAAHPSTFTREMIQNKQQRQLSDYIHELVDSKAESKLRANDFEYLQGKIWKSMSHSNMSSEQKAEYLGAWSQEGALSCMLRYYKAMPQLAPSESQSESDVLAATKKMTIPNIRIHVPTLVLWGEQDQAFVVNVLDDLESYVPELEIIRFPEATHWLHHEIPEKINSAIKQWVSRDIN
ncbi:alpha/beta hydrolase [Alteromonadaceae bacterium M269]|nr:alpha/beta hydrolase [Alteromonadaceae bacterium M269]